MGQRGVPPANDVAIAKGAGTKNAVANGIRIDRFAYAVQERARLRHSSSEGRVGGTLVILNTRLVRLPTPVVGLWLLLLWYGS